MRTRGRIFCCSHVDGMCCPSCPAIMSVYISLRRAGRGPNCLLYLPPPAALADKHNFVMAEASQVQSWQGLPCCSAEPM